MTGPGLIAAAFALAAQPAGDPCGDGGGSTACDARQLAEMLASFSLPAAEARAAAGESIRRLMVLGSWGNPVVAIEYRRAPGHEPIVSVYLPREAAAGATALSASVPLAEWDRLGAAAAFFDRALVPPAPDPNVIRICADSHVDFIETTDPDRLRPGGRLRRRVAASCPAGLANAYADELAESALRLLPACAGLAPLGRGNAVPLLRDCAMLDGDRMAAAEVHNLLPDLRWSDSADRIRASFQEDARLDWNGDRRTGASEAAAAWITHRTGAEGGSFFPGRIFGETSRRVRVEGFIERSGRNGAE